MTDSNSYKQHNNIGSPTSIAWDEVNEDGSLETDIGETKLHCQGTEDDAQANEIINSPLHLARA